MNTFNYMYAMFYKNPSNLVKFTSLGELQATSVVTNQSSLNISKR